MNVYITEIAENTLKSLIFALNIIQELNAMLQVVLTVEESKYALLLQLLQNLDYVEVVQPPVVLVKNDQKLKYKFSDLAGKLQWRGDAVTEQRKMRDEW